MDAPTVEWLLSNIKLLINNIGNKANCRGCDMTIYWLKHKNGKSVPYTIMGLNHFADCPNAKDFKK